MPTPVRFLAGCGSWPPQVASFVGVGLTGYLVATVNLELFFRDPPPPAARGLALMRRWVDVNLVRVLVVTVVLGATARACWELVRFCGAV